MQHSQFGPYRVVRLLGRGGMGEVYEAVDQGGNRVAIKTLSCHLADDQGLRSRFQSEIDTLMKLRHPGIAQLIGSGVEDGRPFFAMEFVEGNTLETLLKSGRRFTWKETVAIAQEILRPLKAAHDEGVVHRDLKPANLMFPPAPGGGFHVKLTDFGIAKLYGETGLTRAGIVVGTPEFMAPEQASGNDRVDRRADLYSLGLVMFAMLAGRPPFQGPVADVVHSQKTRRPPRIGTIVAGVPVELEDLIDALLVKDFGERPDNAVAVARRLGAVASLPESPAAQPESPRAVPKPPPASGFGGGGATRVEDGSAASLPDDLPPTLPLVRRATEAAAARRPPGGKATTVADESRILGIDGGGQGGGGGPVIATAGGDDEGPRRGGSTYTTVAAARLRKKQAEVRDLWIRAAASVVSIAAILSAGWWFLLRPWPWPDPDAPRRSHDAIVAMLSDPHDLGNPCDAIEGFLGRYPDHELAVEVRRLGRERALQMLQRRSFRRFSMSKAKAGGERLYLEAIRSDELGDQAEKLRALVDSVTATHDPELEKSARNNPCAVVENPDEATWRELAVRQLEIVTAQLQQEATMKKAAMTPKERADAMLMQAAEYQTQAEQAGAAGRAADRVVAITRRHQLLEELVERYKDDGDVKAEVEKARRLLDE